MTTKEADKHLKRIQNYLGSTDSMTQFWDACKIAEDALYEVKKLNKSVAMGRFARFGNWLDNTIKKVNHKFK